MWSQAQQTQLYELLGDEPGFSFVCLQESLQHFGLESLTLASACLRLGLQEPGGDALSQAFALHLVTKQVGLCQKRSRTGLETSGPVQPAAAGPAGCPGTALRGRSLPYQTAGNSRQ